MRCDVEVGDPARSHLHDHEDVQHPKDGRHGDEIAAGQHALSMVANKRHPTLRRGTASGSYVIGHIASDGPRWDPNPQLQQEFSGNPLLTLCRVVVSHRYNQFLEFGRNARPPWGLRFPLPEYPKALPMPADEGGGLNDGQHLSPHKQVGKPRQNQLGSSLRSTRFDLPLQIESQLLLGGQSTPRPKAKSDDP